jgi:hypothetical protein
MMQARRVSSCARRAALAVTLMVAVAVAHGAASATWREAFDSNRLDPQRWQRTQDGDARAQAAEIVPGGHRLRVAADTRGARDDALTSVGVMTRCPLPVGADTRVRVRLDWGPPPNGSYLAGAVVLSPHATSGDPAKTSDYLSVGYVGVPPGRNARLVVKARVYGEVRTLFADGWPDENRAGRHVGKSEIEVAWRGAGLEVRENGRIVYAGRAAEAPFAAAHVYLQMTSHSNYAERAIHFDGVVVTEGDDATPPRPLPVAPGCELPR